MADSERRTKDLNERLLQSAAAGDALAQYEIWILLSRDASDPQGRLEAQTWLKKSAEQGFPDAQFEYGKCFDDEDGFPYEAASWYKKAAERGHVQAQYELGVCYIYRYYSTDYEFVEVEDRTRRSITWIMKAAQQGHPEAQRVLGEIYLNSIDGLSVRNMVNYQLGSVWLRKSAEQGVVDAQVKLAALYCAGHGVPQNFVEAYYWLNIAAALRHTDENISKRDEAAARLTKEKVITAQIRAQRWFDENHRHE